MSEPPESDPIPTHKLIKDEESTVPNMKRTMTSTGSLSRRSFISEKDSLLASSFESKSDIGTVSTTDPTLTGGSTDIRRLLIKAYDVIAEKEQELDQAFKVRRAIMDENAALKFECETLKETLVSVPHSVSPASVVSFKNNLLPSESQSPLSTDSPTRSRLPIRTLSSRNSEDSVAELEQINSTLQKRLETLISEKDKVEKGGRKETQALVKEIDLLKNGLEGSSKKIKELEEKNNLLSQQRRANTSLLHRPIERRSSYDHPPIRTFSTGTPSSLSQSIEEEEDEDLESKPSTLNERKELSLRLLENISDLDKINRALAASKRESEEKAKSLELELSNLRVYVSELERNLQQAEQNQYIIDQQAKQISELTSRLEQRQGGFLQQFFSPRSSVSSIATALNGSTNQRTPTHTVRMVHNDARFNSAKGHRRTASASSAAVTNQNQPPRRTLLTELEGEFYRHFSGSAKQLAIADWVQSSQERSPAIGPSVTGPESELSDLDEQSEDEFELPPNFVLCDKTTSSPRPLTSSKESFPPQCEEKDFIPLVPRRPMNGPVGIVNTVRRCAHVVWKWCRFMALLFAAVGVAFYRGPDSDIADYYYD